MRSLKFKIFVALLFLIVAFGAEAGIITDNLGGAPGNAFTAEKLFRLLNGITCWFIRFAVIIIGVMVIIYGLLFFKSRGSPQGMAEAKKAFTWGLVGILVIMAVFTIILSVAALIGVNYPINQFISC